MAALTFVDLQNEVSAQTGLDLTDTTNKTNIKRWINFVQQDILARYPWPYMEGRETVVTVPDYTTGTVSITSGTASVSGSGTTFTSAMGGGQYFIQFAGENDWYKIKTFGGVTALTLDINYIGTSLTDATYIIRKFFYSLSSAADRIIDIRNWDTPIKLFQVDARTVDDLRPNPEDTNSSYGYVVWGYDTSGNIQITPYPFPSDARLFEVRTTLRPTDMSGDSDAPSIPNKYAHVIAFGASAIGFMYLRKEDLAQMWNAKFEQRLTEMKSEFRMSEDSQPIMKSIDSVQRSKWIGLPEQYPAIMG